MKNAINSVKVERPNNNAFDLTHDVKLSCQMGELVPVVCMDLVPGDRVRISMEALVRMMPLIAPVLHRLDVSFHAFFVPNRLVWPNWETWITNGGDNPNQATLPAHPFFMYNAGGTGGAQPYSKLMDYMGLPNPTLGTTPTVAEKVSAIPFAALQLIYDEYYRDENLIDRIDPILSDGDNSAFDELFDLRNRAWEADYFTKALPFAQKGQPVDLPLGEVTLKDVTPTTGSLPLFKNMDNHTAANTGALLNTGNVQGINVSGFNDSMVYDPVGTLEVTPTTINDLRLAFRLQEWLEKNARGGTRYSELIRSHFGVTPLDARLQRPEYITGTKTPIQISEVLNTSGEGDLPQGNMAGHGISFTSGKYGKYFATEHGYLICLMSVMPKTSYFQGIPKHFLKYTDPTELAWPTFAHLGEQEVLNKEIFAFQDTDGNGTFGYQSRYFEYKNLPSRCCTQMRTTLDYWHLSRKFATPPALNSTFIHSNPTTRIFAVEGEDDHLVVQVLNKIMAIRPLPVYGTPTF